MRIIHLANPFYNGFTDADLPTAEVVLKEFQTIYDAILAGTAYVRFIDGDRKGSVARLIFGEYEQKRPEIVRSWSSSSWNKHITHKFDHIRFYCIAKWDGRQNKPKLYLPDRETEFLLDYIGPTIWEKFDAKAAKNEILKNPDQKDINGNVLAVGDRVLYINARYGERMTLNEGTVTEFLASVNSKAHAITTVIENKDGESSSLLYPESMVYKIP